MSLDRAPLAALGPAGRAFSATRRVRWGDVDRHGRLRLDSIARHMQDVSNDETRDSGLDPGAPWIVRRTLIDVVAPPRLGEVLTLTTFCGGLGSRWAERRTTVVGGAGGRIEAASLWVALDRDTGRPARLSREFIALHASAADGRTVAARLHHGPVPTPADVRPWPLRSTDHDPLGHVNNAATWEPVEDEMARRGRVPVRAEIEYRDAIDPADDVALHSVTDGDEVAVWLLVGGNVRASARVLTAPR